MYIRSITSCTPVKGKQYQFAVIKNTFNRTVRRVNYSSYEHILTFTPGVVTDFNEVYIYTTAGFHHHPNSIFAWADLVDYYTKIRYSRPAKYDPKWIYRYICV